MRRGPPKAVPSRGVSAAPEDLVEDVTCAAAVRGGHRMRLPQPQRPQRGGFGFLPFAVDLVGHQDDRRLGSAQHLGDGLVGGGGTDRGIDHDDDPRRRSSSRARPARPRPVAGPLASGSQPPVSTTVNRLPGPARAAYDTRSRVTPGISDDGFTPPEDTVHQRRLADVGASHDGDDRYRTADAGLRQSTNSLRFQSLSSDQVPLPRWGDRCRGCRSLLSSDPLLNQAGQFAEHLVEGEVAGVHQDRVSRPPAAETPRGSSRDGRAG